MMMPNCVTPIILENLAEQKNLEPEERMKNEKHSLRCSKCKRI